MVTFGTPQPRSHRELIREQERSFPLPGGDERMRQMFRESLEDDAVGVAPRLRDGTIVHALPITLVSATVDQAPFTRAPFSLTYWYPRSYKASATLDISRPSRKADDSERPRGVNVLRNSWRHCC